MVPTFIGVLQLLIGCLLLIAGSAEGMLIFLLISTLLGGSAAIILPALGGSSIPPSDFALGFVFLRILLPQKNRTEPIWASLRVQWALVAFVLYGLVASYVGPRIFAGQMQVPPLRFTGLKYIYDVVPLQPSSQNLTTAFYMVGTAATAVASYTLLASERAPRTLVRTAIAVSWIHMILGVSAALFGSTAYGQFLSLFRNGSYAQLDNDYQGYVRLAGIMPEASTYASYAFVWFVFMFECWFRGIYARATGVTAACLAAVLVASTSSSAYVSLAGFSLIFVLRLLIAPRSARFAVLAPIAASGLTIGILIGIVSIASPAFYDFFAGLILHMTVEKGDSQSGLQRAFWALKGWEAFKVSYGLGIGPGSFRSSSILTAILGSSGIIGAITYALYVIQVLKPLNLSTYVRVADPRAAMGAAASWTAFCILIPASVAAPSANPGVLFALFGGAALTLRRRRMEITPDGVARLAPAPLDYSSHQFAG